MHSSSMPKQLLRFLCGISLRVRVNLYFSDPWALDPACYLTDEQIGLNKEKLSELENSGEIFNMPE